MDARQVIFTHVPSTAALHCAVYSKMSTHTRKPASSKKLSLLIAHRIQCVGELLLNSHAAASMIVALPHEPVQEWLITLEPLWEFDIGEPEDSTTGLLLMCPVDAEFFMNEFRKAKRLKIEADFYQEGPRVFEFDVHGLDW